MRHSARLFGYIAAVLVFVFAGWLSEPAASQTVNVIPPTGRWVTDRAGFLSASEEEALSRKMAAYADSTSTQIVIVLLESLDGAAASDYAVELGRAWGVGQRGYDNGVVILVSRDDRQMFIATGYGLEGAITDAEAGRIYRHILVPRFREGRFYEGLSEAVDTVILAARGEFSAPAVSRRSSDGLDLALGVVLVVLLTFVVSALRRHGGGGDDGFGRPRRRGRFGGPPIIIWGGPGIGRRGGGGLGGLGGGGFGGFGGGGGSFGGGGAGGGW